MEASDLQGDYVEKRQNRIMGLAIFGSREGMLNVIKFCQDVKVAKLCGKIIENLKEIEEILGDKIIIPFKDVDIKE